MPRVNVKDKRKHQLMEAGIASIAKRGLADTTIAHVSKGADMSRGIVNFYFTSKEKMMLETLTFLAEEYLACWKEALAEKRKKVKEPAALLEAILHALMEDKLCSHKRMAVWSAFIGHAGTHAGYAKIIRAMDEGLVTQCKELLQQSGMDTKMAEQRAYQILALTRGHMLCCALGTDANKPAMYTQSWLAMLNAKPQKAADKVTPIKAGQDAKPKKSAPKKPVPDVLPGQLDFGDLFSRK